MIRTTKKAQMQQLFVWFIAIAMILAISVGYMVITKAFQRLDNTISSLVDITTADGRSGQDVLSTIRKYWVAFPIVLIGSLLAWAFLSMMKQDPNYPS